MEKKSRGASNKKEDHDQGVLVITISLTTPIYSLGEQPNSMQGERKLGGLAK